MQVVILRGGEGTRAYPYTQKIPKALMTIGEVPIVEQVMRIYAAHGFRAFILSCGYLKEAIFDHFQDSRIKQYGWDGHNLEKDVLPALAIRGELHLYRHRGFWRSMDAYKDQQELNALWASYAETLAPLPPAGLDAQGTPVIKTTTRRPSVVGTA